MGVYLLLVVGAATALTDATAACTAWPACGDGWTVPTTIDGSVAMGHRVVAFLVGLLVVATAVLGWRRGASTRVKAALGTSLALYPIQAGLGALVATIGGDVTLSAVHLVVAIVIFGGLLAALAWTLEAETGDPGDVPGRAPEPDLPPPADEPTLPSDPIVRAKATAAAYFRLMKPRLMWLLCLVASAGMALAGGPGLSPRTVLATLGGGAIAIGASGTFNHVLERDIDRRMSRTNDRPLATELVPVRNAVAFGVALAAVSLALFASVNLLAAALGLVAILFYSVVYTLVLKPNTVQNTVIGGLAGALPAVIGWAAVTGEIGLGGLVLAGVIFLWTPAHFYNLALAYKDDYARGGFPMMPVVRGETATRRHILWYLGATLVAAGVLAAVGSLGPLYVVTGVAVGAIFLWAVVRLHYEQTEAAAFRAFHASNAYLGCLLLAVVVDALAI
ncbi:heme o synthase [Halegenticoccus tardaugens]|uniref:heme o synthase n=1 Tax=Halegenticoccus tardaugens TaxID=2071624 RepID=UPI00100AF042|nr:heme o synthase [Halegenticoccus tardaugens]